jgi:hypothetical protein
MDHRRVRPRARSTRATCSSRRWPVGSCAAWVPQPWTSTASTSRRTQVRPLLCPVEGEEVVLWRDGVVCVCKSVDCLALTLLVDVFFLYCSSRAPLSASAGTWHTTPITFQFKSRMCVLDGGLTFVIPRARTQVTEPSLEDTIAILRYIPHTACYPLKFPGSPCHAFNSSPPDALTRLISLFSGV